MYPLLFRLLHKTPPQAAQLTDADLPLAPLMYDPGLLFSWILAVRMRTNLSDRGFRALIHSGIHGLLLWSRRVYKTASWSPIPATKPE